MYPYANLTSALNDARRDDLRRVARRDRLVVAARRAARARKSR
jgi:hypothetical protein